MRWSSAGLARPVRTEPNSVFVAWTDFCMRSLASARSSFVISDMGDQVETSVPTRSPDTIRSMLRSSSMLKTYSGMPLSMHRVSAVRSMTRRRRSSASMCVIESISCASGSSRGSAVSTPSTPFFAIRIASAWISLARRAAAVSVVKNGLPVPAAKITTRPFSRWRIARRRMYGSAPPRNVIGRRPVHAGRGALQAAVDVPGADDDRDLDAALAHEGDLGGDRADALGIGAVLEVAHERLARQLEQDPPPRGLGGHVKQRGYSPTAKREKRRTTTFSP